jgi:peptide deformylase
MPILNILHYPDPKLKRKAVVIKNFAALDLQQMIDDMFETLKHYQGSIGFAATQLDTTIPYSVTVLYSGLPELKNPICLLNPTIVKHSGELDEVEGCMSFYPGENSHASLKRYANVTVEAFDRQGNSLKIEASGYLARCLQHEIDHLNGIIFFDRLSSIKKDLLQKKIAKNRKR